MPQYSGSVRPDVLVVNRDASVLAKIATCLRDAHLHVIEASSYMNGRRLLSTELPRLLIADVRLGDFNGLNLAWHRELTFPGPTIITDVVPDPVLEAEARKLKAPYLAPAEPRTILWIALQLIGRTTFPMHTTPQAFQELR